MTNFVTLNGHTYSDGNNDGGTGIRFLGNGGHRQNFLALVADVVAIVGTQGMAVSPTANLTVNSLTASAGLAVSGAATVGGNAIWHGGNLASPVSGTGTAGYLPKLTGASTVGNSLIQDNGSNVGIGAAPSSAVGVYASRNITGAASAFLGLFNGTVQADVVTVAYGVATNIGTAAAAFTAANIRHFAVNQAALGAGSAVTNQVGFYVQSNMSGAASNFAFRGELASASNTYNLYMGGTANNYLAGNLGLGFANSTAALHIKAGSASAGTAPVKLTAGTNLATAEAGAVEYDGNKLYMTFADAVRRRVGVSNDVALPSAITVGASPYTYQNTTNYPAKVLVGGGTVSLVEYTRDNTTFYTLATSTAQPVQVQLSLNDRVRVTYTAAPTMSHIPL